MYLVQNAEPWGCHWEGEKDMVVLCGPGERLGFYSECSGVAWGKQKGWQDRIFI